MATSSQVRKWWAGYQHAPTKYVKVVFPGDGRTWSLSVAKESRPVWQAVAQIMSSEPYLFLESAGGTYSKRDPGSNSLHTYALALDLNPRKNPHKNPLTTDMPASFIARMEGIRANGKQAITWGGRWTAPSTPDAMHYQINVSPADCVNVTWDKGEPDNGDDDLPLNDADKKWISDQITAAVGKVWAHPRNSPDDTDETAWQLLLRTNENTDELIRRVPKPPAE